MIRKSYCPFNDSLKNHHLSNTALSIRQGYKSPLSTVWTVARAATERYCYSSRSPSFFRLPTPQHSSARERAEGVFAPSPGGRMCEALAPAPTHSPQNFATGTPSRQGPRTSPQHRPLGCPRRRAQAAVLRRPGADRPAAVPVQRPEVHRPLRSPTGPLSRAPEAGRYSRVMAKRSGRAALPLVPPPPR